MKIQQFVAEDNGNFSSTRLAFLLWAFGILIVWCYTSWNSGMQEVPETIITLLGILMGGKAVQKFGEKKDEPATP